jgi:hypothetical protein
MVGDANRSRPNHSLGTSSLENLDRCTCHSDGIGFGIHIHIPFLFFIQILPIAYFSGYALLPRQLRQEREAAYEPVLAVASEDLSQTDRLLAEEEES